MAKILEYKGEKREVIYDPKTGAKIAPYIPDPDIKQVVNWAIQLNRPLLLKGEPGCGKTQLAKAVARELDLPFEMWPIKSITQAKDGLYTYDHVGRLRDAQLAAIKSQAGGGEIEEDPLKYIEWGALGKAFRSNKRMVVLLDEIDKADLDFPNDLLLELDEKRFEVKELEETHPDKYISAQRDALPIIFITSNDEKELPDAFLRRCLFHYLEFPDSQRLQEIVKAHFPDGDDNLREKAITNFEKLRKKMEKDKGKVGKKVSTSELLDWIQLLESHPLPEMLDQLEEGEIPFVGVLLKNREDCQRYCKI
ncbi:MAG: AAA family ATPase [Microcystaceae cyanobacterium]